MKKKATKAKAKKKVVKKTPTKKTKAKAKKTKVKKKAPTRTLKVKRAIDRRRKGQDLVDLPQSKPKEPRLTQDKIIGEFLDKEDEFDLFF